MVGLGITGDDPPPNQTQPPLADGIHLRWAFEATKGFPLYGYYLFRREHELNKDFIFMPTMGSELNQVDDFTIRVPPGTFRADNENSDHGILLTDSFDPLGQS